MASEARVARGFDRLSGIYEPLAGWLSANGIPRSQRILLPHVGGRRALIVGGGAGGFVLDLLDGGFEGSIVCLDVSSGMLARSRRRIEHSPHRGRDVRFVQGTVHTLGRRAEFDLICTHYVLDLFPERELLPFMQRLDRSLAPGGVWHCSDFAEPSGGRTRRRAQRLLLDGLYRCFRRTCGIRAERLPPIRHMFQELGYEERVSAETSAGLLFSAVYRRRIRGGVTV